MKHFIEGESNAGEITHPEGKLLNDKSLNDDYWRDVASEYQSLRVGLLNVHAFPNHVLHHTNEDVIKLINDNHVSFLGMAEMNAYWTSASTQ